VALHPVVPLSAAAQDSLLSDKRWGGSLVPDALGQPDLATALSPGGLTPFEWTNAGQPSHSIAVPLKQTRWTYVLGVPVTTFNASITDFLHSAVLAALAGVLLISGMVFFTARRIAKSVSQVAAAARKIANEDLSSLEGMAKRSPPAISPATCTSMRTSWRCAAEMKWVRWHVTSTP